MPVITVSRQLGSLGDEIAREVADRLGLRFVDKEILDEIGRRLGVPSDTVSEEREGSIVAELVHTMRLLYPATPLAEPRGERPQPDDAAYLQVIREVIWEIARADHAVIVGRGSPFILPKHPDVLHVLMTAPFDVRVERVMASDGLDRDRACQRVKQVDANRARYIRRMYRTNWLDVGHYDLVVNTGHFSQAHATSLICCAAAGESAGEETSSP